MRIPVLVPVVAVALAAACERKPNPSREAAGRDGSPVQQPSAGVPFYEVVGSRAEDAYDQVKASQWTAAQASVDTLTAALRAAQPLDTAGHGDSLRSGLEALSAAIVSHARADAVRLANHLTEIGAALSEPHNPQVPAAVARLDYYGRELEIWASARDDRKLAQTGTAMAATWRELRPRVVAAGGATAAARFDSLTARVSAARTVAAYAAAAAPVLDAVDALEAVFKR
ncbi:MAG: hypothetical protein U9Q74_06635 [Gemmatimonadota bacterium]|nr:hypothetical protein [Gemmatimonadota bacterium]